MWFFLKKNKIFPTLQCFLKHRNVEDFKKLKSLHRGAFEAPLCGF